MKFFLYVLYSRYESADNNFGDEYQVTVPSKRFHIGFLLICGVLLVLFLITYFIITDLSKVERVGIDPKSTLIESENYPALVVELLNVTHESNSNQNESSFEVEVELSNITTDNPNNHRKFYTVEPQKLVFLPSRHLKPPKLDVPVRSKRRGESSQKRRNQVPKPFNHYMSEPRPAPFKHVPTRRIYRDPNVVGFKPIIPGMQEGFRPIVGSYRRPKGTVPSYYQSLATNPHVSYVTPVMYGHPSTTKAYLPDPFYKYKPPAPSDVNMLVVDQPSREQHLKMYNEQYLKNAQTLYQEVVKASRQKMNELSLGEGEGSVTGQKKRPFQLMLDVYPMSEHEDQTRRPTQKYIRFSPHAAKYNALNSINQEKKYDSSYLNRMRFAQMQSSPYSWNFNHEGKYVNDQMETAGSETTQVTTAPGDHPSQLVVHLNLFPKKKKKKGRKRVKRPLDYDESDEDVSEYFRRSSVESDEIYIDDKDLVMTDKKYIGRPLRSTKVPNKKDKDIEEDSKSIAINFNFPPETTKNCTRTIQTQKFIPMMDGNDNDVLYPTRSVPKAHDFPYRFASMPPAHVPQQRPMRSKKFSERFHQRILKLDEAEFTETTTEMNSGTETNTTEPLEITTNGAYTLD